MEQSNYSSNSFKRSNLMIETDRHGSAALKISPEPSGHYLAFEDEEMMKRIDRLADMDVRGNNLDVHIASTVNIKDFY